MTRNNNVTMSSRSQSRSTSHQRSTSAKVSKISRGRTTQALKHNHTKFVCNALWVWKAMQIHQGRCNVIRSLQAKNQTSSRIQHGLQLLDKRPRQTRKNTVTVICPTTAFPSRIQPIFTSLILSVGLASAHRLYFVVSYHVAFPI